MATIANAAYFGTTGTLDVGADDYTAAVTSFALIPTAPSQTVTDIGGGVQAFVGQNVWQAQVTYNQDWKTAASLSKQLIEWHGQTKSLVYTPEDGGDSVAVTVRIRAGQVGGGAATLHAATVNLDVIGQPTFTPAA